MSTVWAITSGSYSDYRVHGVYLDQADATSECSRMNAIGRATAYDEFEIEELPILVAGGPRMEASICLICDMTRSDGRYTEHQWDSQHWVFEPDLPTSHESCRTEWRPHEHSARLQVWGTDHERVRKVYSEQRAIHLAEFLGIS